jgi:signal transduction histidine kinase
MARALAHEVRNPLAGISGAAQVLREDIEPDEPRHRVLTEILEQVDRLARVVSNILRYARFQPLKLEPVALDDVLTEALAAFEGHLQDQNITVHRTSEADLPQVRVDPGQIQQVFMNLILHASKSMPEGGAIKVGVAPGKDGEKEVQLVRFQDTGTEVPEERLEEIFKPFYTKTSGDTGLGLSVALRIVSLHGGKISALSEAGHGTVYTITLPVDGPTKTNRYTGTSLAKSTGVQ